MKIITALLVLLILASVGVASAPAQDLFNTLGGGGPVGIKAYTSLDKASQGGEIHIAIEMSISPPWHVNAHKVNEDFLVATDLAFELPLPSKRP